MVGFLCSFIVVNKKLAKPPLSARSPSRRALWTQKTGVHLESVVWVQCDSSKCWRVFNTGFPSTLQIHPSTDVFSLVTCTVYNYLSNK